MYSRGAIHVAILFFFVMFVFQSINRRMFYDLSSVMAHIHFGVEQFRQTGVVIHEVTVNYV